MAQLTDGQPGRAGLGSSGGALVDSSGRVAGITFAIATAHRVATQILSR